MILAVFFFFFFFLERYLSSSEKGLNGDSNPNYCDPGAVLYQFSRQTNWELDVMWVDDEPVDYGYRSIYVYMMLIHEFPVSELRTEKGKV